MIIRDRGLSKVYNKLVADRAANPSTTIDDKAVVGILAHLGDTSKKTAAKLEKDLTKPGITRQQQFELVKGGLTKTEANDLKTILEQGTVPMSDSAKNFLEALVGRAPLSGGNPLQINVAADQSRGLVGTAGANVTIEAINLTTAPAGRLHNDDTMVIGKTDAFGKFTGNLPDMQEGDVVRMRARDANGNVGDWVTVKAHGLAARDTRAANVAVFRVGLTDLGNGKVSVTNINDSRQISEPGAKLQFTNARTGEKQVATITAEGQLPANLTLNGRPGDEFSISGTDGTNNTNFAVEAGKVKVPGGGGTSNGVDIKDPALHKDELDASGKPRFESKRFTGPLFKDTISPEDVQQGQIGDCYFPSAMAALAKANPEAIRKCIKENGDGTYTVTFKERNWQTGGYRDVPIKIDGDLYVRSWGGPLYGAAAGPDKGEKTMELWFPLIEKAYASWKGSFDEIGNGGLSSDVFEAVTGMPGIDKNIRYSTPETIWSEIKKSVDGKHPASAGTYGDSESALYTNTGVHSDHSYSILGYKEKDGQKFVTMRNPWGEVEPHGDGKDDGIFDIKLADFMKLYSTFMTARPG